VTPPVEDAERAVLSIARSEWDEAQVADWLRTLLGEPAA